MWTFLFLMACSNPDTDGVADSGLLAGDDNALSFAPYSADGAVVERVAPERYVGLWYEIATSGSFQQTQCAGTTATYTPLDEDTIEVLRRGLSLSHERDMQYNMAFVVCTIALIWECVLTCKCKINVSNTDVLS